MPYDSGKIAIIGMSGAFPSAASVEEFWTQLLQGNELIRVIVPAGSSAESDSPNSQKKRLVPAVACMDGIELFDAAFFGISPAEAEITDPQHRILLEHCWTALEDAGYDPSRYSGAVSVFAGATTNTYLVHNIASRPDLMQRIDPVQLNIGNGADFLTTRISYKLNLRGPSHAVQSACSTSLVAVHCACRSLLDLESDMALAGGVSVNVTLRDGYHYTPGGIVSPDGHCRAFDAQAAGTVFGSGVGVVVLKRLEDALNDRDTIYAVILGSAINNDGLGKVGFTAPSVDGQAQVITEALANAGVEPGTLSYVECHGTGTTLGDPIEIRALAKAFGKGQPGSCGLGSVKTNAGHLDAAAGITGLIKVTLSLKHGMLPPILHFSTPNPEIHFENTPFYVHKSLAPWNYAGGPRRAGVSAFGVGGTNAHVVMEEAPALKSASPAETRHLLLLSAKTETALARMAANLGDYIGSHTELDLADVAYTLQVGRQRFSWRRAIFCRNHEQAITELKEAKDASGWGTRSEQAAAPVAFLFPGQGAQYAGMGRQLYREHPVFRHSLDECSEILRPLLQRDLVALLCDETSEPAELDQTWLAQPALLAIEYGLAQLWMSWGVKPHAMLGHSLGDYTAACLAGVMTLKDGLSLVARRGQLMQQAPVGAMLAVSLSASELEPRLLRGLEIAAVNAPGLCSVAGSKEDIAQFELALQRQSVMCQRLRTSHAFHSYLVEAVMEPFREEIAGIQLRTPEIPFVSSMTGTWITDQQATDPGYWALQMRARVRFDAAVGELLREPDRIFLEVGPGKTLCRLAGRQADRKRAGQFLASLPNAASADEYGSLLQTLGRLWEDGALVDWVAVHSGEPRRISLPTYPFERQRYWVDPRRQEDAAPLQTKAAAIPAQKNNGPAAQKNTRPALRNAYIPPQDNTEGTIVAILEKALGIHPVGVADKFGELGGDSLMAVRIVDEINAALHCNLRVLDLYEGLTARELAIHLGNSGDRKSDSSNCEDEKKVTRRQQYRMDRRLMRQQLQNMD